VDAASSGSTSADTHGRSDHAPATYDLAHYGGDVVRVLEELGAAPAALVGHSLGGVVAWWVAQNRPDLIRALFLEDPPLYTDDRPHRRRRSPGRTVWGTRGAPPFREIAHDDAVAAMGFGHRRLDVGVVDGAIDGSTLAATDRTSPVAAPTVLLAADQAIGSAFTNEHAARLARTHPGVEVIRIAGCGHGIHDERRHRDVFVQHLQRFLDEHAPAR
jgi:pimeloyl-ACP methyl ester carboxylesterase